MKREDLKQYSGRHVTVVFDGKETSNATMCVDNRSGAYLSVAMPVPDWIIAARYTLTDADVASLSDDGSGGLIGAIYLKREGDLLKWDAAGLVKWRIASQE